MHPSRTCLALAASIVLASAGCGGGGGGGGNQGDQVHALIIQRTGTGSGRVTGTYPGGSPLDCPTNPADCSVSIADGTPVTLTAIPSSGSVFAGWNGCDSWTGTTCNVTMTSQKSVSAVFNTTTSNCYLEVRKQGTGTGTVTGGSIACGSTCLETVACGTSVTLTATADAGSTFAGWTGCSSSGATCTVTVTATNYVYATFNSTGGTNYTLTVQKSGTGTGTVTGTSISCGATCSASYSSGTAVTLTATPASGSTFSAWTNCDSPSGSTCTMTMNANKTVTASFNPNGGTSYTLTVQKGGTGTGTVTGTSIDCGATCSASYSSGTAVTLTATPASGSTFSAWTSCDSPSGSTCTMTMNANKTVTASFTASGSAPAAPTNLAVSGITQTGATLSWTDNSTNETAFEVGRCTGLGTVDGNGNRFCSSGFTKIADAPANATSYALTGLTAGTPYGIYVRAYNSYGSSNAPMVEFTTSSAQQTVTLNVQYDNCVGFSGYNAAVANQVFQNCDIEVGVNWYTDVVSSCVANPAAASMAKFNVSTLSGKTIDSAVLNLQTTLMWVGYYPQNFRVGAIATSWNPSTVNWNTASNFLFYTSSWLTFAFPTSNSQTYNIDLRATVQAWANGTYANNGLYFESANYALCPGVMSFDAYDFAQPTLTVTYH